MNLARRTAILAAVVGLGVAGTALPAGAAPSQAQLKLKALSLSDMPIGWSVDNSSSGGGPSNAGGCLKVLGSAKPTKQSPHVNVAYEGGPTAPALVESVSEGKVATTDYAHLVKILNGCTTVSLTEHGVTIKGAAGALNLPTVGQQSHAYVFNFTVNGINLGLDVVAFRAGPIIGTLGYMNIGPTDTSTIQGFADEAAAKAEGKPATPPPSPPPTTPPSTQTSTPVENA